MNILERINAILRPISMYKGILFGLFGIWLAAVVLACFGLLSVTPLELCISLLVACSATWLGSWLTSLLFGVHSQIDSSLITSVILTLIITPTTNLSGLAILFFAGLIAGASKYVVVWKGRHIFNPAALAVVVISIAGLGGASWWVATPVLAPIVALVGAMALYQTKRFAVAGIFLAITIPLVLIQLISYGASFAQSLGLLLSWPLLFIVGVMLVEPLTLPPRKWQIYVVTVVVAVLVAVPITIGPIQTTPAIALLVGNLVAAILARRAATQLTFLRKEQLTPTSFEYFFKPSRAMTYEAGQYIELSLPHARADLRGERRSFSITSAPGSQEISLGIRFYQPSSAFKKALANLNKEVSLQVTHCSGDFILPKDTKRPLLFIAGGIGITPFISQLRSLQASHKDRDIVIVYAVSSGQEFAYQEILASCRVVVISLDRPVRAPNSWQFLKGSRIDFDQLLQLIPDHSQRDAYISGPTPFVQSAAYQLRTRGIQRVTTDYFAGY